MHDRKWILTFFVPSLYLLNYERSQQKLGSILKFMISKKATKIDEIFTIYLTVTTYCQINGEDLWPS